MELQELKKFKSMKGSVGKEVESQKPFISDPTALHNQHQILEKLLPPSNKLLRNGTNSKVDIFLWKQFLSVVNVDVSVHCFKARD